MSTPGLNASGTSLAEAERVLPPKPLPDPNLDLPPMDGVHLLSQITEFIARYLHCSEHQRTVLALWVLHTHCIGAATLTPYLAIRSDRRQSGKTLCLQLLSLLFN